MKESSSSMFPEKRAEEGAATSRLITPYKPDAKIPLSKNAVWRLLLTIEISMFSIAVDVYSIPVAVPALSSDNLGYLNSAWIGTSFLAPFALGFLIWPRVCKGFAHRFSFAAAMWAFSLASCDSPSDAKTAARLIAMHSLLGAGAGGACGILEMVLRDIVPPKEFNKYMSVSGLIWVVAAACGPLASGALVDCGLGPLSYDLGPLLGTIGVYMALGFMDLPGPFWTEILLNICQFDYCGSLCLINGISCIMRVSASSGTIHPWIAGIGLSITGLALLGSMCLIELSVPDPLLHPSLFLDPSSLTTAIMAFFYGANLYGTLYYVPHFFQLVLDDGAFISSLWMMPMTVAVGVAAAGATFITPTYRSSINSIAQGGAALMALASGLMVRWSTSTTHEEAVVVLALLGLGQGTVFIGLLRSAQTYFRRSPAGAGSSVFIFFQALGAAFGVACFAALYTTRLQSSLGALMPDIAVALPHLSGVEDDYVASLKPHVLDAYGSSMQAGWCLVFIYAMAVLALSFLLGSSYIRDDMNVSHSGGVEKRSENGKRF